MAVVDAPRATSPTRRPPVACGGPPRDGPIVCAVDGSAASKRALREADALAHALGSRLLTGTLPAEDAAALARAETAELVVVGVPTRARIGSALIAPGLTALLRDAHCPVVAVPPAVAPEPGRFDRHRGHDSIVCGVRAGEAVSLAARVAGDLGARLRLRPIMLHAHEPGSMVSLEPIAGTPGPHPREADAIRAWARLARIVDSVGDSAEGRLAIGWPAQTLRDVAARSRSSLIVIGSSGPGFTRSLLCGSVSARLAASAGAPVVIVPRGARRWPAGNPE